MCLRASHHKIRSLQSELIHICHRQFVGAWNAHGTCFAVQSAGKRFTHCVDAPTHAMLRLEDPWVLEAQHRVGGRIYTMREPFARGLYGEAGAMRIPRSHELTLAYVDKFGLPTSDFVMGNPQAHVYVGGIKRRLADVQSDPGLMGFEISEVEKGKLSGLYWEETIRP